MGTSLNKFIHERWAADEALVALLPAAKFVTGTYFQNDDGGGVDEPRFPYATLTRPGDTTDGRFNDGSITDAVVARITIYHGRDNHDEGLAIADAVKNAFRRAAFDVGDGARVINMQREGYAETQDPASDDWFFVIDFACQVHTLAGSGA